MLELWRAQVHQQGCFTAVLWLAGGLFFFLATGALAGKVLPTHPVPTLCCGPVSSAAAHAWLSLSQFEAGSCSAQPRAKACYPAQSFQ